MTRGAPGGETSAGVIRLVVCEEVAVLINVLICGVALAAPAVQDTSKLKWNPVTVAEELKRYEPVLAEFGVKDPLRWARARMKKETNWATAQAAWERRIAHWRRTLLADGPGDWQRWLDVEHPALRDRKSQILAGGATARRAWAEHVHQKFDLLKLMDDSALRGLLLLTEDNGLYAADGSFLPMRAEALLENKVYQQLDLPVLVGEPDYGWVQIANPSAWFMRYLAAAWYHQRDEKWVNTFQDVVIAMVMGNNYDIAGFSTVSSRHNMVLPTYLLMKDSPAMSPRFHAICSRWLWAHAQQVYSVGNSGYKDNTLAHIAFSQFLPTALFPEFAGSKAWERQFWPLYLKGWRRELLADHCHQQRSMAYHLNFVRRALPLLRLSEALGQTSKVPNEFRRLLADTVDVYARLSTPTRMSPGVNDDAAVFRDHRPLLRLAADLFDRDDWRYLATDGRTGEEPGYRSVLMPTAQLVTMRSDWSREARWLFFKVSPQGNAHHHRDTLGIQIHAGGRPLLIEPYTGDYLHERAVYNRSWWHSTPTLGATMQPFRTSPKILHWKTSDDLDYAVGRITAPVTITRHVFFVDRRYWVLWDEFADVPDGQSVWENFHFATRNLQLDESRQSVTTAFETGANLTMQIGTPGWKWTREDTRMWPRYGRDTEPTATVHLRSDATAAKRGFAAMFSVAQKGKPSPRSTIDQIDRLPDGRVRLHVSADGVDRVLMTGILGRE